MAVVFYYFYAEQVSEEVDTLGAAEGSYGYLLVSIILLTLFLYSFYQREKNKIET